MDTQLPSERDFARTYEAGLRSRAGAWEARRKGALQDVLDRWPAMKNFNRRRDNTRAMSLLSSMGRIARKVKKEIQEKQMDDLTTAPPLKKVVPQQYGHSGPKEAIASYFSESDSAVIDYAFVAHLLGCTEQAVRLHFNGHGHKYSLVNNGWEFELEKVEPGVYRASVITNPNEVVEDSLDAPARGIHELISKIAGDDTDTQWEVIDRLIALVEADESTG